MDNVHCQHCGSYSAPCVHEMCLHMQRAFGCSNTAAGFDPCDCPPRMEDIEEDDLWTCEFCGALHDRWFSLGCQDCDKERESGTAFDTVKID